MSVLQRELSRRRLIRIIAATASASALGCATSRAGDNQTPSVWRGTALGALASIELYHEDSAAARRLIGRSLKELERLEQIFSLYRPNSSLCVLNRTGFLETPPTDLLSLLSASQTYYNLTGGVFDPSVQVLWDLYSSHFFASAPRSDGPPESLLQEALSHVGYKKVSIDSRRIALPPGMALTLNGIAQGYLTDRVTDLLKSSGVEHVLVDLGEIRVIGRRPDRRRWAVGLEDPDLLGSPSQILNIENSAVATSGGYGFRFDDLGRFTHLFNPKTGRSPRLYKSVSVVSATATTADALSTAFSSMEVEEIRRVLEQMGGCKAYLTMASGEKQSL